MGASGSNLKWLLKNPLWWGVTPIQCFLLVILIVIIIGFAQVLSALGK